ncbi:ScbA/BarX family gamma-butyrolactone biosynthesis protein [Streptomyces pilosus]|uniref:ScbA/BarX family gamma-butyrolactone biosynthesis protein n=1 Tax=Streptomyces pilosus TaxID=28893 RepID=UPI00363406CE
MPQPDSSSAPREDQTGQRASPANGAGPAAARTLVTPELAHRPRAEDVFPAAWVRLAEDRFRVTAHWPAAHSFFGPVDSRHQDPMIVGETLRQTSMALAHAEFGAPADTHFVMHDLEVSTDPAALLLADAAEPVTVDVVCSEVRRRGRGLNGMRTTMEFRRAGLLVARGTGSTGCLSPAAYRRLRGSRSAVVDGARIPLPAPVPPAPVPPALVGRHRARDVVLAPADRPGSWLLRVDGRHPVLFPRPNDHVPGMVLFEAARQAAAAASGRLPFLPSELCVRFSRYAELDSPCRLDTEVLDKGEDGVTVRVSGRQDDEPVFAATLTCSPTAPVRALP